MMPKKEYVSRGGYDCPKCKGISATVTQGKPRRIGSIVDQDCTCTHCPQTWTDHYKLTGYTLTENQEETK